MLRLTRSGNRGKSCIGGNVDERREKFITQQVALQIPSRIRAQISRAGDLSPVEAGRGKNSAGFVRTEESSDYRGGVLPRPYPYAGGNPALHERGRIYGVPEKQEQPDDFILFSNKIAK